jgi:small subunit ribosomal protein S1
VARVEAFGAFVEVAPGVEGLVHVSELGRKVGHPREVVKPGQAVQVTILGVDGERRRLSLSLATGDEDDVPAALPRAPERLGTLGDLLKDKAKRR